MCLLVPGKIIKIEKDEAIVDYDIEKRKGMLLDEGYNVGDYVMIQGGIIVQKIPEKDARSALELYKKAIANSE